MLLLGIITVLAGVWAPVYALWVRLPTAQAADLRRWLVRWAIKGLATPVLLWAFVNLGISEKFPPLIGQIQAAASGWATVEEYFRVLGAGMCIIGTYWAAMTLAWLLPALEKQAEDPPVFKATVLGSSAFLAPIAVLIVHYAGFAAAGIAGVIWFGPIVYTVIPMAFQEKKGPVYHRAIVKIHGDKYREAESAVLEELEKKEDDFLGWMMLAELYATQFGDLAGAERIVYDTCSQPTTNASEVCLAFNHLADWYLSKAEDPVPARKALTQICGRYPGTPMAQMAKLRISQLPATREEYIEQRKPKAIRLPSLGKNLEETAHVAESQDDRKAAAARANECVKKLEKNPDNMTVREELARILAEQLGKTGAAIEQIELLMNMPEATTAQAAEWQGLVAAWQIKYQGDAAAGRETMERLVSRYPQSAAAATARRRISLMDLEEKARAARAKMKTEEEKPLSIYSH